MPNRIRASAAILAFLSLASCSGPAGQADTTIVAGKVAIDASRLLSGDFTLGPKTGNSPSPPGMGGACLVAQIGDQVVNGVGTCSADSECHSNLIPAKIGPGWQGYCIQNKCWVRPGTQANFCNVSIVHNGGQPYANGTYPVPAPGKVASAAAVDALPELATRRVHWRIHACLNTNGSADCRTGGPNKIIDDGPVAPLDPAQ